MVEKIRRKYSTAGFTRRWRVFMIFIVDIIVSYTGLSLVEHPCHQSSDLSPKCQDPKRKKNTAFAGAGTVTPPSPEKGPSSISINGTRNLPVRLRVTVNLTYDNTLFRPYYWLILAYIFSLRSANLFFFFFFWWEIRDLFVPRFAMALKSRSYK